MIELVLEDKEEDIDQINKKYIYFKTQGKNMKEIRENIKRQNLKLQA